MLNQSAADELFHLSLKRMKGCFRPNDIVLPLRAGMVLILIIGPTGDDILELIAERVSRAARRTFSVSGFDLRSDFEAGVAIADEGCDVGSDLLDRGLAAVNHAHNNDLEVVKFFPSCVTESIPYESEGDLLEPFRSVDFETSFHPQFGPSGIMTGTRLTFSLRSPSSGAPVPAAHLQNHLEEVATMLDLGNRMWLLAVSNLRQWKLDGYAPPLTLLPIEAPCFLHPTFSGSFVRSCLEARVPPETFHLLVDERALSINETVSTRILGQLSDSGVGVSLRARWTGVASSPPIPVLSTSHMRVHCAALFNTPDCNHALWLTRALVFLAEQSGVMVTAEGVCSQAEQHILAMAGCQSFEGPLFSEPLSFQGMTSLLAPSPK